MASDLQEERLGILRQRSVGDDRLADDAEREEVDQALQVNADVFLLRCWKRQWWDWP